MFTTSGPLHTFEISCLTRPQAVLHHAVVVPGVFVLRTPICRSYGMSGCITRAKEELHHTLRLHVGEVNRQERDGHQGNPKLPPHDVSMLYAHFAHTTPSRPCIVV